MRHFRYCAILLVAMTTIALGQEGDKEGYHRSLVRGRARLEEGNYVEAVEFFKQALELEPGDMDAGFSLATAMMGQLKFEEALEVLEPIREKRPDNPTVKNNMAWCLLNCRDPKVKDVRRALSLSREAVFVMHANYNLWHTLASIHYELEDYERAKRVVSVASHVGRMTTGVVPRECAQLLLDCMKALGEEVDGEGDETDDEGSE